MSPQSNKKNKKVCTKNPRGVGWPAGSAITTNQLKALFVTR